MCQPDSNSISEAIDSPELAYPVEFLFGGGASLCRKSARGECETREALFSRPSLRQNWAAAKTFEEWKGERANLQRTWKLHGEHREIALCQKFGFWIFGRPHWSPPLVAVEGDYSADHNLRSPSHCSLISGSYGCSAIPLCQHERIFFQLKENLWMHLMVLSDLLPSAFRF